MLLLQGVTVFGAVIASASAHQRLDGQKTIVQALGGGKYIGIDDGSLFHPEHYQEATTLDDVATGYWLTDAAEKDDAKCLDGTPGVYYHQAGTGTGASKWYIHQQGGGWCESFDSCLSRSNSQLGSSKDYPKTASLGGGYFSSDPAVNPLMYNWNKVYMRYCDGNSFSGSNASVTVYKNTTLHWRGKHILKASIDDLLVNRGLDKSTDVVVSGCSAGGLATFLHCDHWAERLAAGASHPKVVCMPDSGFFLDMDETGPEYHTGMTWAFHQQNSTSGVNDACIAAENPTSRCMFAEHTAPHIKTPMFPLQAQYDSWQINNDLANTTDVAINAWGKRLTSLVEENLLKQPQHGIFLDSCKHHCGEWGNIRIDGDLQGAALQKWYEHGSAGLPNKGFYNQNKPYPCDSCCQP